MTEMKKIILIAMASVVCFSHAHASTYCGKVEATYYDKADGGPGVVYELLLKNNQKSNRLSINVASKNPNEEKLKKSIMNLIDFESDYCFEGIVKGQTLNFESVKLDDVE